MSKPRERNSSKPSGRTWRTSCSRTSNARIQFTTVDGSLSGIFSGQTGIAVDTQQNAQSALDTLTSAIATVSQTRGTIGSYESRLLSAITNLRVARENFSAAEGRIRDTDVAEETANLTRANILQQAGVAVLAQANQQPTLALQLLR